MNNLERGIIPNGEEKDIPLILEKINKLPGEFSIPKNPKGIARLKNNEGDIEIDFLESVKINFPCFQKCTSISYEKPDKLSAEFHYKDTNYFLNFE